MSTHETQAMPSAPVPGASGHDAAARRRRWQLVGGVAAAVALLVGVFFVGRATGSSTQSGPTSLGEAITAARAGSLPCGSSSDLVARTLARLCHGSLTGVGGGSGGGTGGAAGSAGAAGARALQAGTVTGVNGNQVTIQTGQGATLSLTIGSDADVRTTTLGSVSDLASGDRVLLTSGGGASSSGAAATRQILVLRSASAGGVGAGGATPSTPPSS